jgi:hypothetical protein
VTVPTLKRDADDSGLRYFESDILDHHFLEPELFGFNPVSLIGGKLAVWSEVGVATSWSCAFLPPSSTRSRGGNPGGHGCWARRPRHE